MTKPTQTGLEPLLCHDLYAASHAFSRCYAPLLTPLGLTYPQYLVMVTLWAGEPLFVKDIGQRIGLETNTLTPLIKRMERAGLLVRQRDDTDERKVRVSLTASGRALQEKAAHIPARIAEATGLNGEEIAQLQTSLRRLSERLTAEKAAG